MSRREEKPFFSVPQWVGVGALAVVGIGATWATKRYHATPARNTIFHINRLYTKDRVSMCVRVSMKYRPCSPYTHPLGAIKYAARIGRDDSKETVDKHIMNAIAGDVGQVLLVLTLQDLADNSLFVRKSIAEIARVRLNEIGLKAPILEFEEKMEVNPPSQGSFDQPSESNKKN